MAHFLHPYQKLKALSKNGKQLWVVCHVNGEGVALQDRALADVGAACDGGADAVVLINQKSALRDFEIVIEHVRTRFPELLLGVNYLGDEREPYGFRDGFRLARTYGLGIVWSDFSGVDLIEEKPGIDLNSIEAERPEEAFYCSGVHMKYGTLKNPKKPVELSALQAMGWVDGVILTGPKTGVPADPAKVRSVRQTIGKYPLGVASGASPENVHTIVNDVDFFLVASSLENGEGRTVKSRVADFVRQIR